MFRFVDTTLAHSRGNWPVNEIVHFLLSIGGKDASASTLDSDIAEHPQALLLRFSLAAQLLSSIGLLFPGSLFQHALQGSGVKRTWFLEI